MTRKSTLFLFVFALLALSLTACSSAPATSTSVPVTSGSNPTPALTNTQPPADLSRSDLQGSVEFTVTPLNLASPAETLEFEVVMDTHSVDLAWDLAAQSTLKTDTGLEVQGQSWPLGNGHHYEGALTFPVTTAEGRPLLDGAKSLTLTIRDTDVNERVFVWELSK